MADKTSSPKQDSYPRPRKKPKSVESSLSSVNQGKAECMQSNLVGGLLFFLFVSSSLSLLGLKARSNKSALKWIYRVSQILNK